MMKTKAALKEEWHAADEAGDVERRAQIGRELVRRWPNPSTERRASIDKET